MSNEKNVLRHHLDDRGRLLRWPSKPRARRAALQHLIVRFERGITYSEKQVNALLEQWHVFGDPALLRRELYQNHLLDRTRDGRSYWVEQPDSSTD